MALDFMAAKAVARAKMLERAVHDPGPWQIEVQGMRMPATKVRTPSRVLFLAYFPDICWIDPPEVAWLYCGGQLMGSQDIVAPAEGAHTVQWSIGLEGGPSLPAVVLTQ